MRGKRVQVWSLFLAITLSFLIACGGAAGTPTTAPTATIAATAATTATAAPSRAASPAGATPTAAPASAATASRAASPVVAASATTYPLSIDNCGTRLTLTRPPERVVSSALNGTEIMLALGLQGRLAGVVGNGDRILPQYKPAFAGVKVLTEKGFPLPAREVIVSVSPDFLLSGYADDYGKNGFGTRESFQSQGTNTYLLRGSCGTQGATLADTFADIETLGRIFGVPDRAAALIAQMKAEAAGAKPPATPVRVLNYDSGEDQPFTTGGYGLLTDLIAQAGGKNVFADVTQAYFTANWEEIVRRDPEVIVLTGTAGDPQAEKGIAFLTGYAPIANIGAIKNRRFVVVDITSQVPSVRNGAAIATLAAAFAR